MKILKEIRQALGLSEGDSKKKTQDPATHSVIKSVHHCGEKEVDIGMLLDRLSSQNACKVFVSFAGSGDSGEIYDVEVKGRKDEEIELERELIEDIEEWVYAKLEEAGVDWYNNEGGSGEYNFYQEKGVWKYDFVIHVIYEYTECEHLEKGVTFSVEEE